MDRRRLKEEAEKFFHELDLTDETVLSYLDERPDEVDRLVDGEELTFAAYALWDDKSAGSVLVVVAVNDDRFITNIAPSSYGDFYQLSPASMAVVACKEAEKKSRRCWRFLR